MKIIKNSLCIATMAVLSFSMVSCENENIDTPASVSEVNGLNASQSNDGLVQTRARSHEWHEVEYPYPYSPGKTYRFSTSSAVALSEFDFKFGVRIRNSSGIITDYPEIYLKTYSPIGKIEHIKMRRRGDRYYLYQSFDKNGIYHYRYFARHPSQYMGNTLISISESNSFNVTIPITLPPMEDNKNYPYKEGTVGVADKWGFFQKECVSYVAWKVNQMWKTNTAFNNSAFSPRLSNAYKWKDALKRKGYKIDNTPRPGDIAWWDSNVPGALALGHVAFVEKVYGDGSILISEYNGRIEPNDHKYGTRRIYKNRKYPTAFIHVQIQRFASY